MESARGSWSLSKKVARNSRHNHKSKPEGVEALPKGITYQPRPNGQENRKPVVVSSIRTGGRAIEKHTSVASPSKFQEALEEMRKDPGRKTGVLLRILRWAHCPRTQDLCEK